MPEDRPMEEYSPLRFCSGTLQDLDDLLPKFLEAAEALDRLHQVLGNGELHWTPPTRTGDD